MRYVFGGGVAEWTLLTADEDVIVGALTGKTAAVVGGITVTFWNQRTGGWRHTDLVDVDGIPIADVVTSVGTETEVIGQIPVFLGPDGVTELWASANGGPRARIVGISTTPTVVEKLTVEGLLTVGDGATSLGSLLLNTSSIGGGQGALGIGNASVVPNGNPTDGGVLYAEGGSLKWRGSDGTTTVIAPA